MIKKIFLMLVLMLIPFKVLGLTQNSYILMDEDTKRILVSKNKDKKMLIASTTKIMTAVVAIESGKTNKIITVNDKVLESYGSSIYLKPGEQMKLKDMLYGLLMQSGNDAALMISDYLGGEEKFVLKMNKKAKQIGMKNTIFENPNGLDERTKNYSTAYDMAILMRYANSLPLFKKITMTKKHIVKVPEKTYVWYNENKLLYTYKYTTGGKTGFTEKAGRTLVTSASNNDLNLVAVTLNYGSDFKKHKELYEYGFDNYKMVKVFNKDELDIKNKSVYAKDDYFYPITEEEKALINVNFKIKDLKKPKNNQIIGSAIIRLGNHIIHREKLYIRVKN